MNTIEIIVVRVYITEHTHALDDILKYLSKEAHIRGITVFRAIRGFGETGEHSTSLLDLSLDLPLVVEFFDEKDRIEHALKHLHHTIKPKHVIFWKAHTLA